jgi:hypothetical protein
LPVRRCSEIHADMHTTERVIGPEVRS